MGSSKKKRVGIWIRVSTEDQARGESPEHHEKRARYYAEAKEWHVAALYDLSGVSGKTILGHPEAERMLADIKSGHITALIFSKLARLARNTRELLDLADYFREHDAGLISLQESIDTTSPAGRLFYTMLAAMAQWEREEISERVAASIPIRAELGKCTGGAAPFGYQWKESRLIPHPEEAPVRALMYELYREHKRLKTVARLLNEKGHRTRKGAKFSDTSVRRLLTDSVAKGLRRANYTKSTGNKKHWVLKPKEDWVYSAVEPIVSEELWNECNAYLDAQTKKYRKRSKTTKYLFSGVVRCHCGTKMYPAGSPSYRCKTCKNKIACDVLEDIFQEQLSGFLESQDDIESFLIQLDDVLRAKAAEQAAIIKEQTRITKEMDKLYELYMSGEISKTGFGRKHGPLEERLEQIEQSLPKMQAEIDYLKIQNISSDQILADSQDLAKRWPSLPHEAKAQLIENITDRITISDDQVDITFTVSPFFLKKPEKAMNPQGFIAAIS